MHAAGCAEVGQVAVVVDGRRIGAPGALETVEIGNAQSKWESKSLETSR